MIIDNHPLSPQIPFLVLVILLISVSLGGGCSYWEYALPEVGEPGGGRFKLTLCNPPRPILQLMKINRKSKH